MSKLNMRQRRFAENYVRTGNIVQSAIAAGYSEKYANSLAHKLLENMGVATLIRELSDKIKDEIASSIPMKRRGVPEDVANVIAFLCSDYASYVTGEVIRVDGGIAM